MGKLINANAGTGLKAHRTATAGKPSPATLHKFAGEREIMVVHDLKECLPKGDAKLGPITVIDFNNGHKDFGYITGVLSAQVEFNGKWINRSTIRRVIKVGVR